MELPIGSNSINCKNIKNTVTNTIVKNVYQIGCRSVRIDAILQLIMKIIDEPFVDTIRCKDKLSHTHYLGISLNYDVIGYFMTVHTEEPRFKANHVAERIDAFNNNILKIITKITQDELDKFRNNLIKSKQILDKTLEDEVNRNWEEIQRTDYMFDRKQKEIEVLTDLKKTDIIDFWRKHDGLNQRRLSVQVIGNEIKVTENNHSNEVLNKTDSEVEQELLNQYDFDFFSRDGDSTTIVNINHFKENLNVFPVKETTFEQVKF